MLPQTLHQWSSQFVLISCSIWSARYSYDIYTHSIQYQLVAKSCLVCTNLHICVFHSINHIIVLVSSRILMPLEFNIAGRYIQFHLVLQDLDHKLRATLHNDMCLFTAVHHCAHLISNLCAIKIVRRLIHSECHLTRSDFICGISNTCTCSIA